MPIEPPDSPNASNNSVALTPVTSPPPLVSPGIGPLSLANSLASIQFWDDIVTLPNGTIISPGNTIDVPLSSLNPWNLTYLNGELLAGITIDIQVHSKRGHNPNGKVGTDQQNPIIHGLQPAPFTIEQWIWDYNNFNLLTEQIGRYWIDYIGKGQPPAFSLKNPLINQVGIIAGYLVSITGLQKYSLGGRSIKLEFLQQGTDSITPTVSNSKGTAPDTLNGSSAQLTAPSSTITPNGFSNKNTAVG
jgi:hypothetical protein